VYAVAISLKKRPGGIAYDRKPPSRRLKEISIPLIATSSALAQSNQRKGCHGTWRWNCFQYKGGRQINPISSTQLKEQTDSHGVTHGHCWLGGNGLSKRISWNRRNTVCTRNHRKWCIQ
jgi:hypothetical protein